MYCNRRHDIMVCRATERQDAVKGENGDHGDEKDQTSINWPLNHCETASFSAHCQALPRFLIKAGGDAALTILSALLQRW